MNDIERIKELYKEYWECMISTDHVRIVVSHDMGGDLLLSITKEAEVSTDGLCRFLVGPGRSAAGYIMDTLREIHATRHAELLRKFTSENGIDLDDLGDLRIENSWEYEDVKGNTSFYELQQWTQALLEFFVVSSIFARYNKIEKPPKIIM